jgi:hypothetical protein
MKALIISIHMLLLVCYLTYGKSTNSNIDTTSLKYHEISNIISIDLFETIKIFILNNGDREGYSNMYNNNPHYTFYGFESYLNPEIGQANINCDTNKSDFNEIVIRDMNANPQYYYIHIVRKGDLEDTLIHTWEGMSEEKVYLLNFDNHNMDSMLNNLSKYLEIIKKEFTTGLITNPINSTDKFSIYPNPVLDKLFINCDKNSFKAIQIEIINFQGLVLQNQRIHIVNAQDIKSIDVSSLKNGFYLCRIKVGESIELFKFVKR